MFRLIDQPLLGSSFRLCSEAPALLALQEKSMQSANSTPPSASAFKPLRDGLLHHLEKGHGVLASIANTSSNPP